MPFFIYSVLVHMMGVSVLVNIEFLSNESQMFLSNESQMD